MDAKGLKLIGKGLFSKVYRLNNTQVLIKTTDHVKELLSMGWINSEGVFPELERVDYSGEQATYIGEYFPKVKSLKNELNPDHYAIYKELRSLSIDRSGNKHDKYAKWYAEFKKITDHEYREALLDMVDNLTNYGTQIEFEISPRNVAVKNGRLILLDVFFMSDKAEEIRTSKRKKHQVMY